MTRARLLCGDAREVLRDLPAASVQCCVTSVPYWGLRTYGTEPQVWGGDPECAHQWDTSFVVDRSKPGIGGSGLTNNGASQAKANRFIATSNLCSCGAWRGELGLEPTPELYGEHIVEVFRLVRQVLRDDGVLWLNIGDCYASGGGRRLVGDPKNPTAGVPTEGPNRFPLSGLKAKDLVGIPWMLAFALRADGWWLRSEIIWAKQNVMPESVKDRPTKAHEQIFLLAKSQSYYYDAAALVEPASADTHARYARGRSNNHKWSNGPGNQTIATSLEHMRKPGVNPKAALGVVGRERANPPFSAAVKDVVEKRNARTVWNISTRPYAGAHFATFPEELARRCILASSKPGDTVLDPFGGSGTVAQVATGNGRNSIYIDLNPKYLDLARQRVGPMLCEEVPDAV